MQRKVLSSNFTIFFETKVIKIQAICCNKAYVSPLFFNDYHKERNQIISTFHNACTIVQVIKSIMLVQCCGTTYFSSTSFIII